MKKIKRLYSEFIPERYELFLELNRNNDSGRLLILGYKVGKPSRRITLHQKGLRVLSAEIWNINKKNETQYPVNRINHLKGFEEVRLHSGDILYPGKYKIKLLYQIVGQGLNEFKVNENNLSRLSLPSIDEPEAWANAKTVIKP